MTTADILGRGIGLQTNFDADERAGSIPLISGVDVLKRDTAFALASEIGVYRGALPDEDFAAEIELATRRVLARDDRVANIGAISVDLDSDATTVAVDVGLTAADSETEELIVKI